MKKKISLYLLLFICAFTLTGCFNSVKIKKAETKQIQYEDFNNGLISLKIPKGWKVEVAPADYII